MNEHDATEVSFNNGYKNGAKDAVRKMQERIKTEMDGFARIGGGEHTYYLISKSFIDRIAKEMLEVHTDAE